MYHHISWDFIIIISIRQRVSDCSYTVRVECVPPRLAHMDILESCTSIVQVDIDCSTDVQPDVQEA